MGSQIPSQFNRVCSEITSYVTDFLQQAEGIVEMVVLQYRPIVVQEGIFRAKKQLTKVIITPFCIRLTGWLPHPCHTHITES